MQIRYLNATFGKLQQAELSLQPGFNLIYAPNESGKSTWSAFIRNMFYGLPTRDRSPLADKHRFAPWSGAPMRGQMDVLTEDGAYTIIRQTQRANSPMGSFSCTYTGTGTPVPGITGPELGQLLLGVPREVFERSAFISQSGLPVDHNAELDRRITALITTGEEDTSYTESYERLKKQLNRRRHNRTGLIPNLERETEQLRDCLDQVRRLQLQLEQLQAREDQLAARQADLQQQLAQLDSWELARKEAQLQDLSQQRDALQQTVHRLQQQLTNQQIPDSDTIHRLCGAIDHAEAVSQQVRQAREAQTQAEQSLAQLQEALQHNPLAGYTGQQAQTLAHSKPAIPRRQLTLLLLLLVPLGAALYLGYLLQQALIPCLAAGAIALCAFFLYRRLQRKQLEQRFGTADPLQLEQLAHTYITLLQQRDAAQADAAGKAAAARQLAGSCDAGRQAILQELQRYAPAILQLSDASAFLSHAADVHRQLSQASEQLRLVTLQWDLARQDLPQGSRPAADLPLTPPAMSRPQLQAELAGVQGEMLSLRSSMDRLIGQLRALGDRADLESQLEQRQEQLGKLQEEYEAIALAMDVLSQANTTLQNRFSPELGARAAQILSQFTAGRYDKVLLDRDFALSAQQADDPARHNIQLLSQGTADQAYLAVRLAICQLVLPREKAVPLILDDVFANFDDIRLGAALDWLLEESRNRQILLFTCQKREGQYLDGRAGVTHLSL